jgi:anti-anti-sigma factor
MLTYNYNQQEKVLTCSFSGRMDSSVSPKIDDDLETKLSVIKKDENNLIKEQLVFDLKGVDYISSSFIRTCVRVSKQLAPGKFSIINCDPFIKKTFKIVGLDEVFNIR